ncbi:hypothetical protein [Microcystis sp. LE19-195.1E]|uniref:hypothetical protein n=1 Tax=Microcystis sp. LE19-195.1E TaxID=3016440 RepID=UPI002583D47D|nr:hypothetical protein [Microcystis sp. LE19-195.1E]
MKMGKTPHPTPHTLHPAPRKNFFSRPYLELPIFRPFPRRGERWTNQRTGAPMTVDSDSQALTIAVSSPLKLIKPTVTTGGGTGGNFRERISRGFDRC